MSALASAQLLTFWGAVCLGMKLAAVYALPAALREELHFSWQLESLLDLLYFTAAGLISFLYLLSTVDGILRWFVLAGEVIGAVLLRLTVYRWLLRLLRWPLRLCCKLLHGVGKLLGAPVSYTHLRSSRVRDWRTEFFQRKARIPLENRQGFIV